ncbi:class I SAM-dependent methyltransferase [uncultured Friedmanniella sp.]|uniref:class I SAM-dependent methyltransferase n=1 Tax=uncultured Friedmanniella sp. TaxID=335381 RepID=UPI0035CAE4B3
MSDLRTGAVARLFDDLSPTYDQSGVAFFSPVAERLVALVRPVPGEQVADFGCGRGAVALRIASAVGPDGSVTAMDLAPGMVAATAEEAERRGLTWLRAVTGDAGGPDLPAASLDLLTASLVLFFLPDPLAAVRCWLDLLGPGGRIGITTFGEQDEVWRAVDDLFDPYLPPGMLDPRTAGRRGPFSSESALAALVSEAGGQVTASVEEPLPVRFADVEQWERFSLSTGQRQMWQLVPEPERAGLRAAAGRLLESARPVPGGAIEVRQVIRCTLVERL